MTVGTGSAQSHTGTAVSTPAGPLNTILYGPPGTGKTYRTISRSVEICDGSAAEGEDLRVRYDELVKDGRIAFVTFHQSYGYEEFVEGIRPVVEDRQVVDGILKRLAESARKRTLVGKSFDALWLKLQVHAREKPLVRTQTRESEYFLTTADDSIALEPVGGGHRRAYRRERVERLWSALRKDPEETTPAQIQAALDPETHGSFLWVIYKELWQIAQAAEDDSGEIGVQPVVLVIDEINRANISKVMGELITLLEEDKRQHAENELGVTLPYSRERFTLPGNLHILGTSEHGGPVHCAAGHSVAAPLPIRGDVARSSAVREGKGANWRGPPQVLIKINERLEFLVERDHLIGHAWLMQAKDRADLDNIIRRKVIPLIAEYFYDDWTKVRAVLGGTDDFLRRVKVEAPPGLDQDLGDTRYRWSVRNEFEGDAYEGLVRGHDGDAGSD